MQRKEVVRWLLGSAMLINLAAQAHAQDAAADTGATGEGEVIVTAARSALPPSALPLTIDLIDKKSLDQQIAISGSVIDAVATLTPSFSPTRQKLSGAGETLRGRSPLYAINGIPQSTPLRDGSRDGFTIDGFFVDRVELIYGSNALQGIGGTGGIVNQVTVGAPRKEGLSGRVLLQGSADNDFQGDGLGGKAAGLVQYKADRFDATVGASYEKRGVFYDGDGRRVGLNLTQGETQDSKTSRSSPFRLPGRRDGRLDLIASRFELKGDGDYVAIRRQSRDRPADQRGARQSAGQIGGQPHREHRAFADRHQSLGRQSRQPDLLQPHARRVRRRSAPIATFQDAQIAPLGTLVDQSENRSRKYGGKFSYEHTIPGFDALTATLGLRHHLGFHRAEADRDQPRLGAAHRLPQPRAVRPAQPRSVRQGAALRRRRALGECADQDRRLHTHARHAPAAPSVSGGKPTFHDALFNGGVIVEPCQGHPLLCELCRGLHRARHRPHHARDQPAGVDIDNFLDISPIVSNNREIGFELKRGPVDSSRSLISGRRATRANC
jgi:iron complex outermembrane receptor protein